MALADSAKNLMLTELASVLVYMGLHNVDAPTDGTSEISGGSPAYARKAVTWGTASGGAITMNGTDPVFDVPTGVTVKAVGFWSAVTAGTFYGYHDVTDEVFGAQGTYTVTDATINLNK